MPALKRFGLDRKVVLVTGARTEDERVRHTRRGRQARRGCDGGVGPLRRPVWELDSGSADTCSLKEHLRDFSGDERSREPPGLHDGARSR